MRILILFLIGALTLPPIVKTTSQEYHDKIFVEDVIPNLVTNGDFSNGTTGWDFVGVTISNVDNDMLITIKSNSNASSRLESKPNFPSVLNDKYYVFVKIKTSVNSLVRVRFASVNLPNVNTTAGSYINYSYISVAGTQEPFRIYPNIINAMVENDTATVDYTYIFNISTLIISQQYSPLFSTTFDLMSDAEIKTQLDYWVANNMENGDIVIRSVDFNVDMSSLGNRFLSNLKSNTVDFVENVVCSSAGIIQTVTLGAIKKPGWCPGVFAPLPWVHQTYWDIMKFLNLN